MSLRSRLLVAAAAVAFVALVAADLATYASLRTFLYNQVDTSLQSSHVGLEAALTGRARSSRANADQLPPPGRLPPSVPTSAHGFCAAIAGLAPGAFVEVRTPRGKIVPGEDCPAVVSGGSTFSPLLPPVITGFTAGDHLHEATRYFTTSSTREGGPELQVSVSRLKAGSRAGDELVLAMSLDETEKTLGRLVAIELAVTGGALFVAVLLGWLLVGLGLRPLRRVERTAEAIARGELAERVPGANGRTEVGQVALALNVMLENIELAFAERDATEAELRSSEERLRRFVADASHELRTPIAAVSAYAELFDRAERPEQDLPRIMGGIAGETRRMGRLVEDLLLLARLDEGRPVAREPVELVDLVAGALETARTVGPQWPVRLEASGAVEVVGDHPQLRQVVDNLLGNVRAHTPPGTSTKVRVGEDETFGIVEVKDDGPGLSPERAARVFERFYRADPSRARSSGGAGLGLSIVASIVEAHGGSVSATSDGSGTIFTVRLPLSR